MIFKKIKDTAKNISGLVKRELIDPAFLTDSYAERVMQETRESERRFNEEYLGDHGKMRVKKDDLYSKTAKQLYDKNEGK